MFAVIRTGGKQYRVAAEDLIKVDKVRGNPGEIVQFGEVLVIGSFAVPIAQQPKTLTIDEIKKRRRKNSRRRRGHRQEFTLLRVTEILTDGAKPSQTARPKREPKKPAATAPAEAGEPDEAKRPKAKAGPKTRGRAAGAKKPAKSPAKKPQKPKSGGKD